MTDEINDRNIRCYIHDRMYFDSYRYDSMAEPDVTINYIDYGSNSYYSDREVDVDIDKETAVRIVEFLKKVYNI